MKMKNKGILLPELLTILGFVVVILALVAYIGIQQSNRRKYEVFAQNARDFVAKVSSFREETARYDTELYLIDLVDANYIKPFKNPFSGGGNCDLYESKVIISSDEKRVTFKCGSYLIDNQLYLSSNYRVYKVSEWKETIDDYSHADSAKLYNYYQNNKLVSNKYLVPRAIMDLYNDNESTNITSLDNISNLTYNTFWRTKELVKENL